MAIKVCKSWAELRKMLETRLASGVRGWHIFQPDSAAAPVWEALKDAPVDWEGAEVLEIGCRPVLRAKAFVESVGGSYEGVDFAGDPEKHGVISEPAELTEVPRKSVVLITTTLQCLRPGLQKELLDAAFKVASRVVLVEHKNFLKLPKSGIKILHKVEIQLFNEPHLIVVLEKTKPRRKRRRR